ncbi:hypothetical protein CPLU01_06325 [Colletotrichum plurivorum]|uniref:Uncharacterized protein n=1 Tax=Colletotrichum plurivorum TaxID=2175906 RepID=A0A8H6KK34_9PEZI|nr:hypothetical protein CPLU01_06325 [Colletotrichum plurivorum]
MHSLNTFVAALGMSATVVSAFTVSVYQGQQCRSANLGSFEVNAGDGCRNDRVGTGRSLVIHAADDEDEENPYMLVLFSSDDCNPATIIAKGDRGCLSSSNSNYGSFEVWDVMNVLFQHYQYHMEFLLQYPLKIFKCGLHAKPLAIVSFSKPDHSPMIDCSPVES